MGGGVLYPLNTVYANDGGVLKEIYSGSKIDIYATNVTSSDQFEVNEYDTGISVVRNQVNTTTPVNVYIKFKGVKSGDRVVIKMNYCRAEKWLCGLTWFGCNIESDEYYAFHISKGYIDIYGNTQNTVPSTTTLTATSSECGVCFSGNVTDTTMPLYINIYSIIINGKEQIKKPYTNYFSGWPVWTAKNLPSKNNPTYDAAIEIRANMRPTSTGFYTEIYLDPKDAQNAAASATLATLKPMTVDLYMVSVKSYGTPPSSHRNPTGGTTLAIDGSAIMDSTKDNHDIATHTLTAGTHSVVLTSAITYAMTTGVTYMGTCILSTMTFTI